MRHVSLPRRCVFCGHNQTTKEHVWGDWLTKHFPPLDDTERVFTQIDLGAMSEDEPENTSIQRPGHILTHNLKVVCQRCNNGWMSQLQQHAGPIILSLSKTPLTSEIAEYDQRKLARWLTMVTMTCEFSAPDRAAISPKDRDDFRLHLDPNKLRWRIWIGAADGGTDWKIRIRQLAFAAHHRGSGPKHPKRPNIQSALLVLEKFCALVFSTNSDAVGPLIYAHPHLPLIWPPSGRTLAWPPGPAFTGPALDHLSLVLERMLAQTPHVRVRPFISPS
jgi:hypothetical protein